MNLIMQNYELTKFNNFIGDKNHLQHISAIFMNSPIFLFQEYDLKYAETHL